MEKIYNLDKKQLCEIALKTSAKMISKQYKLTELEIYQIYKEQKIQSMLMLSNDLILKIYFDNKKDIAETCLESGINYQKLASVLSSHDNKKEKNINQYVGSCPFKKAEEICKDLGYKDAIDYIKKEGSLKFKKEITPQL